MTLCFQGQFLKQKCIQNTKGTIKNAYNSERKKRVSSQNKISPRTKKKKKGAKQKYRDPDPGNEMWIMCGFSPGYVQFK